MDPGDFARILERFSLSAEGYRKVRKGVQKRIVRHMQELRCPTMKVYLERLETDRDAEAEARRLMDVSISRLFRDEALWQTLEKEILPALSAKHPAGLRVWSAGCALGQEVYSIAILRALLSEKTPAVPPLELWATDVNPVYLERAREGIFSAAALSKVPPEIRTRFFRPAGKKGFCVVDELRKGIHWQVHDLATDSPPAQGFHLVFLRNNLLTYYRKEIVDAVLPSIVDSLAPGGYLVIGRKEQLPGFLEGFRSHEAVSCLLRKQGSGGMA